MLGIKGHGKMKKAQVAESSFVWMGIPEVLSKCPCACEANKIEVLPHYSDLSPGQAILCNQKGLIVIQNINLYSITCQELID